MNFLEQTIIGIYRLLPARNSSEENVKIFEDLSKVIRKVDSVLYVFDMNSKIFENSDLAKTNINILRFNWPEDKNIKLGQSFDLCVIDTSHKDVVPILEFIEDLVIRSDIKAVILPISFNMTYESRPVNSVVTDLLQRSNYSLFNLYNVKRIKGQIDSAHALFINEELRSNFLRRFNSGEKAV
jgi:hypothetical protein